MSAKILQISLYKVGVGSVQLQSHIFLERRVSSYVNCACLIIASPKITQYEKVKAN